MIDLSAADARRGISSRAQMRFQVLVIMAGLLSSCLSANAEPARRCWTEGQLLTNPGEERIRVGTPEALVDPPKIALHPLPASPHQWRGALRRVDLPKGLKIVALTFDLCEQPHEVSGYQGEIVEYLRREQVAATFFVGGKWLLTHPSRAEQLVAEPLFEIGNHSWEHRNLRLLEGTELEDEIWNASLAYKKTREALIQRQCLDQSGRQQAGSVAPKHATLFRFPFGACDDKSLNAVEQAGLRAIQWDVSSADPSKSQTASKMARDVLTRVRPGSIVLFHANGRGWHTSEAIKLIVGSLKADGYGFATVSELLRIPGARPVTEQRCYDARPGDTNRYDSLARTLSAKFDRAVAQLRKARQSKPDGQSQPAAELEPAELQPPRPHPAERPPKAPIDSADELFTRPLQ